MGRDRYFLLHEEKQINKISSNHTTYFQHALFCSGNLTQRKHGVLLLFCFTIIEVSLSI